MLLSSHPGAAITLAPRYRGRSPLLAGGVVSPGRVRAFVRGHGLGIRERAAGLETGGDACLRRKIPCTWPRRSGRRLEWPAGPLRRAHEGQTAELDGKSYFGADQKNIIKLSLCLLLPLDLKMSH
jgi:hypothetical protein